MQKIISGGNELLDAAVILTKELKLGSGAMVGDLGCGGAAYFTLAAAKIVGDRGQVYAVDVLKTVLSSVEGKARMHSLYNIKTIWSNLEVVGATNIPAQSLDDVLLVNILFQSKKHEEIITEAARLLRPGGKLLIIDWDQAEGPFGPGTNDRVDQQEVREIAGRLKLAEESSFKAGQYHFGLIFSKVL